MKKLAEDECFAIIEKQRHQGNVGSFLLIMSCCKEEYVMFCDWDDIWNEDKIEISMRKFLEIEVVNKKVVSNCVYTDMEVVNESLEVLSKLFYQFDGRNPFEEN